MKSVWGIKPLGDVCEFQRGLTYAKTDEVEVSNSIVLRATNIDFATNLLDLNELRYINDAVVVSTSKKVKKDSLLICTASGSKSHLGKVAYIAEDYDFAFGGFMGMLTPREVLNPRFFFYLMTSGVYRGFIAALADGANINNLKFSDLQRFPVPVPPLPEQHRIVAILDEAFDGITTAKANAEKNLQNARALFESHLQSVFTERGEGWVDRSFEDCIEDVKYPTKIQRSAFLKEGWFPIVSQEAGFINGYWNDEANVFKVTNPVVIFGDHTQVLKYVDFDFVLGADGVKILPPKDFLQPKFFFYALRSAPLKSLGYARHYRLLKELRIGYPVCVKQQAIVSERLDNLLEETQRLESLCQQKLIALDEVKNSLLHRAFSGVL